MRKFVQKLYISKHHLCGLLCTPTYVTSCKCITYYLLVVKGHNIRVPFFWHSVYLRLKYSSCELIKSFSLPRSEGSLFCLVRLCTGFLLGEINFHVTGNSRSHNDAKYHYNDYHHNYNYVHWKRRVFAFVVQYFRTAHTQSHTRAHTHTHTRRGQHKQVTLQKTNRNEYV